MAHFREKNKSEIIKIYKGFQKTYYEKFEDTIKYFNEEQIKIFLNYVREKDDPQRQRNYLIMKLLLSTGMRINEFSLTKINDIDFFNNVINIPYQNTKTSNRRTVRVNKTILLDLKDYLQNQNIKSGYIFRNVNNNPLSTRTYQYIFDKYYFEELPFKPTPHTLRHSHIVLALKKGVPINAVQQNVGHMNLETTQIYCRLAGVDIANGYKDIEF